jgi:hypothetical protein
MPVSTPRQSLVDRLVFVAITLQRATHTQTFSGCSVAHNGENECNTIKRVSSYVLLQAQPSISGAIICGSPAESRAW